MATAISFSFMPSVSEAPTAGSCAIAGLSRKGDHLICQFASVDDKAIP